VGSRDVEKLTLIRSALALRRERPAAFEGSYEPLEAGPDVAAFVRGDDVAAIAVLRDAGQDATVEVPWLGERRVGDLTGGRSYALLAR
jgi:(1->4)-alpha-D-glucan 1-alpha-D-glucosylmutase